MSGHAWRAVVVGVTIAAVLGLLHGLGLGLPLLMVLLVLVGAVAKFVPHIGVRWLDELILAIRSLLWRRVSGRHHSFAGISLDIEEAEGQMWMSADSLQRALRQPEAENVTAARLADHDGVHARHNDEGVLMLNVQAVVHHLSQMPGRTEPRILRLRTYLERDVLFPASRRAAGAGRPRF